MGKFATYPAMTAPTKDDLLVVVNDPGGTPATQKLTLDVLATNAAWALGPVEMSALSADFTLSAASGVQAAFPTGQRALTILASTAYRFRGKYILNTGATTHTTALAFLLTTATVSTFEYFARTWSSAANAVVMSSTATTQWTTHVSGVASKVINATNTQVYTLIEFEGMFRTTLGGTITPQINFSANPTGTNLMKLGSYIEFWPIGGNTMIKTGTWA